MPTVFRRVEGKRVPVTEVVKKKKSKSKPKADPKPKPERETRPEHRVTAGMASLHPLPAEPCHCEGQAVNGGSAGDGWRCIKCGRQIVRDDPRLEGKRV
jgi:hypothetical protein